MNDTDSTLQVAECLGGPVDGSVVLIHPARLSFTVVDADLKPEGVYTASGTITLSGRRAWLWRAAKEEGS